MTTPFTLYVEFRIGDFVYARVEPGRKGMVVGYDVRPGFILYYVVWQENEHTYHYDIELTSEPSYTNE